MNRHWQRHGAMGMISLPYRVGKFFIDGCTLYGLWHNDDHLGYFNDFDECQQKAEEHAKGAA
jgi:hypothetical protein